MKRHASTDLIHHDYQPPAEFEAPQPPVCKASTVFFPNVAAMRERTWLDKSGYTYGLHGTPTSYTLEERLCALEGGRHAVLVPSGLAAIACVNMALLHSGDEVLLPDNAYGPSRTLADGELDHWGIAYRTYDPMDVNDLADKIGPNTRLVWLEAAGSVTLEFPDLLAQVRTCRELGVLTALDNTWGAGLAFQPFDLLRSGDEEAIGVDISIHALTKYPSGGGDVLMGSVITRDPALHKRILLSHMRLGFGVGMNDVEAVLRSLPSMALRYQAADRSARHVAQWCTGQPQFAQVLHPSLPDAPGHDYWKALCVTPEQPHGAAAGLVSVVFEPHYTQDEIDAFCDSLRLFRIGYSWGGPVSLVMPYELETMRDAWPEHIARGTLVRLCIGLEDPRDLEADLAQALLTLPV
ncbi:PLP-dependent transferase [Brachymonas denitrificans]|uniref:PLP-dependent transferase n=1 Tax=Brachymonas denitrificans TaxID=28220 RepID=UPI001BCACF67|nr:PLP-dependent transferase [Brachymonas denitrificans]